MCRSIHLKRKSVYNAQHVKGEQVWSDCVLTVMKEVFSFCHFVDDKPII